MNKKETKSFDFDEKSWIEKCQNFPAIDEARLKSVFYFSLIWNLFEKNCCDSFAKIEKHPEELSIQQHERISNDLLNNVFDYFKNRYIKNGSITDFFYRFKFARNGDENNETKRKVKECLLKAEPCKKEKLEAILLIAFRLRNNLFHGTKEVARLYEQNENFYQINHLLTALIELHKQFPVSAEPHSAPEEEQNA